MSETIGRVKWFNIPKGYGFIQTDGGSLDTFVHANQLRKSGIIRSLIKGEKVKCTVEQGPKGSFATNLVLISEEVK